ncbi:MAG: transporter [Sphingomonadales bacterium]|nr:transporter [Sphingomonadales bacterium]MDE2169786.1 transporter [Sphingomonadales bacterium]
MISLTREHARLGGAAGCLIAAMVFTSPALASENGNQHFPIGVLSANAGTPPPEGMLQVQNYMLYQPARSVVDANGVKEPVPFKLDVAVDAPRFLYTWKGEVFAGLHYTTALVVPLVHLNLDVAGSYGHDTMIGDVDIGNYLGKTTKSGKVSLLFGFETYVPSGHYDPHALINTGSNVWTFAPSGGITYRPTKRLELTAWGITEFNTTNHATHYHSGSDVDIDFGSTWRPFHSRALNNLGFGVQGYFYKQYGNDTVSGVLHDNGYKGQEFGLGPQIRFNWPFGGILFKYQHAMAVENRPKGDRFWIEFAVPLFGKRRAHG